MLKRLQLVGFKSFADRTEFDFPAGVTAVVGPNGSGKSNVVDAVRWVLGEQSAKSLRGGEMTDVIFNGSASRRSLGLAEVTMTFDNTQQSLATDSPEVQITRRVYRSGEGEYLINGQVSRLKDIKDLFLGSGAGNDAYSIIEQGRVDVLLQASTKERRTIFEEAAGISRFKVKKVETLRKLERVDQNLARLKDILDEVEKQLRSVKLQAAKAERYQEHTARLRELRVGLGLLEYGELNDRLGGEEKELTTLRAALAEQMEKSSAWERELATLESELSRLDGVIHEQETALAEARERIAGEQATLGHEWALSEDLELELGQTREALARLTRHVAELASAAEEAWLEVLRADAQRAESHAEVLALETQLGETERHLANRSLDKVRDAEAHMEAMRESGRLQNDVVSYRAQVENLTREQDRRRQRTEQATEHLASIDLELEQLTTADAGLQDELTASRRAADELRQERDRLRELAEETTRRAAALREERTGLLGRVEVLEQLERSHEGLGAGAQEVYSLLDQLSDGPWKTIVGIVADVLTVRREYAPLIDLALGERAQRFLVRDMERLHQALGERGQPFSSRVSFLPVSGSSPRGQRARSASVALAREAPHNAAGTQTHPGVIARADEVVRCEHPEFADLPARLLGGTLIVRDLTAARAVQQAAPGTRCVTLRGELLEPDGTVTTGTHHADTGILSRKSELRELREQTVALEARVGDLERDLEALREQVAQEESRIASRQNEIDALVERQTDLRSRIAKHRQKREGLEEEVVLGQSEMRNLEQEIATATAAWQNARDQASAAEERVHTLKAQVDAADRDVRQAEAQRQVQQQHATAARVRLAQAEERLSGLRARHQQCEADRRQRTGERSQAEAAFQSTVARRTENQLTLLNAYSALAAAHRRKESAEGLLRGWEVERAELRARRQELQAQSQSTRTAWQEQQQAAHARELAVNESRHKLETLCARLQEDYQLDLSTLFAERQVSEPPEESAPLDVGAANEEIGELRRKLSRLGSVNLEAIQELSELEARASALHLQYDDLAAAQKSLTDIIARINADSRKLFTDTFETIRGNFQELFRKLFGGGMADILLEDPEDVLETGIEIMARPPGKELRSISLMSGGEKTLTAVALLLAIFRSKPSPFCILDEVDAALDEANIARFTGVLREFLDRSQFIIVTHSKRTMACADVLYGVTMAESGVSRRVAVRFEDWPDEEREAEPAA